MIRLFSTIGNKTCTVAGDVVVGASGKLDVQNTGSDGVLNIGGNLNVSGTLQNGSTTGTINFTGSSCQFTASGTVQATALSWAVNSGKSLTMNNNLTVGSSQTFTVNGTLNCGANVLSGAGAFALNSGGTLGIGSALGITSSGSTGNIQNTTRSFNTAANYTYNGSASQAVGNGLPATVNNLTIANTGSSGNNTVTLAQNTAVNGTFSTTSGTLDLNGKTLTAASAPSLGGGLQMEIVNAVAANNLTLSGGTLTYGGTLTVANSGTLASGNSFTLFTAPGNSFSGWFSTVTLPALASGLSWDTNTLRTSGVLNIYAFTTNAFQTMSALSNTPTTLLISKVLAKTTGGVGTLKLVSASGAANGTLTTNATGIKIGRASCRERV